MEMENAPASIVHAGTSSVLSLERSLRKNSSSTDQNGNEVTNLQKCTRNRVVNNKRNLDLLMCLKNLFKRAMSHYHKWNLSRNPRQRNRDTSKRFRAA